MATTFDYYKLQQGAIPSLKHGSNWFWIRVDFSKQPVGATDVLKLCELKEDWILKCGFTRVTHAADGAATMDLETSAGGDEVDAAIDIDSATDTWLRTGTLDDDAPQIITADGYLYATINSAACHTGVIDILLEVIICADDVNEWDSLAEAN